MPTRSKAKSPSHLPPPLAAGTKLDAIVKLLRSEGGATIETMTAATGWQQHSVRGALAGSLKKKGLTVTSKKIAGIRVYRVAAEVVA